MPWISASKIPGAIRHWAYWWIAVQGGKSAGESRQGAPTRTTRRRALRTWRKECHGGAVKAGGAIRDDADPTRE
jgi:hypothetical protein